MDALPVREASGLPYASTATGTDAEGDEVPLMHACGHDMHVACLLASAQLLAQDREGWAGTVIALFQPAEEIGIGASSMVDDGLAQAIPTPDVALGQHVMGLPHDTVASRPGPAMSAADSARVTVHGRGTHGFMPHSGVDAVLLASSIVVRLQGIVARELAPDQFGVVTVGSIRAGSKSNVIPGEATLLLNLRSYDDATRSQLREAVERIVRAECEASGSPRPPEITWTDPFPLTDNSPEVHARVSAAFTEHFGDRAIAMDRSTGSEDFSDIPRALGAPYLYWVWGGFDPETWHRAPEGGTLHSTIPDNHASTFVPVAEPTLRTGTSTMTVALMTYLAKGA